MAVLMTKEWVSPSGLSYCNQPDILKYENANKAFEYIWDMSPLEFLLFVAENYNASVTLYKNEDNSIKFYTISFKEYGKCHRFVLDTNNQSRKNKCTVEDFLSKWG